MNAWLQLGFYLVVLIALAKPLGAFMANVYEGKRTFLAPVLGWLERLVYRVGGVNADEDMTWKRYLWATLSFNAIGFFAVSYTIMAFPIAFIFLPRLWSVSRVHNYVTPADFIRGHKFDDLLELRKVDFRNVDAIRLLKEQDTSDDKRERGTEGIEALYDRLAEGAGQLLRRVGAFRVR